MLNPAAGDGKKKGKKGKKGKGKKVIFKLKFLMINLEINLNKRFRTKVSQEPKKMRDNFNFFFTTGRTRILYPE